MQTIVIESRLVDARKWGGEGSRRRGDEEIWGDEKCISDYGHSFIGICTSKLFGALPCSFRIAC